MRAISRLNSACPTDACQSGAPISCPLRASAGPSGTPRVCGHAKPTGSRRSGSIVQGPCGWQLDFFGTLIQPEPQQGKLAVVVHRQRAVEGGGRFVRDESRRIKAVLDDRLLHSAKPRGTSASVRAVTISRGG